MLYIKTVKPGQFNKEPLEVVNTPEQEDKSKWCVLNKAPIDAIETVLTALGIADPPLQDLI
jgi:hypothetical protein